MGQQESTATLLGRVVASLGDAILGGGSQQVRGQTQRDWEGGLDLMGCPACTHSPLLCVEASDSAV